MGLDKLVLLNELIMEIGHRKEVPKLTLIRSTVIEGCNTARERCLLTICHLS